MSETGEPAWLNPALMGSAPVKAPPTARVGDVGGARLLHLNEVPLPPSPAVATAISEELHLLHRYPDVMGTALAQDIGNSAGFPAGRIVFGCGSEELIFALATMALGPGDSSVLPAPSFPTFAVATRLRGARAIRASLGADGANDPVALLAAIEDRTQLVFACTPNPPSGGMMRAAAIEDLARNVPADKILVVDEAYHEFGRHAGGPDALDILSQRTGYWVILRTFSKAYGLAGCRIGYALCSSDVIAEALRKVKLVYGATRLSQAAARAALADTAHLARTLAMVSTERTRLSAGLTAMGLDPWPSVANFVSVRTVLPAADVVTALRNRGILVRDWRDPEYLNEIRITVGLPDDTDAVLKALADILGPAESVAQ